MSAPPQKGSREKKEEPERVKKKVSSGDDGKEGKWPRHGVPELCLGCGVFREPKCA